MPSCLAARRSRSSSPTPTHRCRFWIRHGSWRGQRSRGLINDALAALVFDAKLVQLPVMRETLNLVGRAFADVDELHAVDEERPRQVEKRDQRFGADVHLAELARRLRHALGARTERRNV